jgi:hypothetical protein
MKKLAVAIFINITFIFASLVWPQYPYSMVNEDIESAYKSICQVSDDDNYASGVLLESGYVLSAAHAIDRNEDGEIDDEEKHVRLNFSSIGFVTTATAVAVPSTFEQEFEGLDIALLKPEKKVPLKGSRLLTDIEYEALKIGEPVTAMGLMNNDIPPNITQGNLVAINPFSNRHRCSTTIYYGSSGGGVFTKDNELVGISVAVRLGEVGLTIPIMDPHSHLMVGHLTTTIRIPLANSAVYTSATAIQEWLIDIDLGEVLETHPTVCPYRDYFPAMLVVFLNLLGLLLVFKALDKWVL